MSRYISSSLADQVTERAQGRCEYCRISIADTYFGSEIDHIQSLKHGGETNLDNLAIACQVCNRRKGTDLGSVLPGATEIVRFFNPRIDIWSEHFIASSDGEIEPLTHLGRVTSLIFGFNDQERIDERIGLIEIEALD